MTELSIEELKIGSGAVARVGTHVVIHAVGGVLGEPPIDNSGRYEFWVGGGEVIAGWERGVEGMHVGGIRRLTVPASLGYGDRGVIGSIRPGATLVFEIELVEVTTPAR